MGAMGAWAEGGHVPIPVAVMRPRAPVPSCSQMEVVGSVRDGGTMSKGVGWFLRGGQTRIEQALSLGKIIHGFSPKKAQKS